MRLAIALAALIALAAPAHAAICVDPGPPDPEGVSVLDYIDQREHAPIRDQVYRDRIDGPDVGPCVQAALDAVAVAGGRVVRVPAGSYPIATGLRLPSNVELRGPGAGLPPHTASLRAKPQAGCADCTDAGYPVTLVDASQSRYSAIVGVQLDGGARAVIPGSGAVEAIRGDCSVRLRVEDVVVYSLPEKVLVGDTPHVTAAVRGSGMLYTRIRRMQAATRGYSVHAVRGAPCGYYGINAGSITDSELNSWRGVWVDGSVTITGNSLEPKAVDHVIRVSGGHSWVDVSRNYIESSDRDGDGYTAILVESAAGRVEANHIYGPSSVWHLVADRQTPTTACDVDNGITGIEVLQPRGLTVAGNGVYRADCGMRVIMTHKLTDSVVQANHFGGVKTRLEVRPPNHGRQSGWSLGGVVQVPERGRVAVGVARVSSVLYVRPDVPMDLGRSNAFDVTGAGVVVAPINAYPGQRFDVLISTPGVVIPAEVFGLAAGRDVSPPVGVVLPFIVDRYSRVREVGLGSLAL
ncbi:MAG: hypothetical protein ACPGQD_01250 [Planctomycetota bacterium]